MRGDGPVLALLVTAFVATLAAERYGVALREFRIVFLDGVLFYVLITRMPWPRGTAFSPWPLIYGLLVGMTAVALLGLWQLFTGVGRIDVEGVWRVRALYGSPNNLALLLDRAVPLALALTAFGTVAHVATGSTRDENLTRRHEGTKMGDFRGVFVALRETRAGIWGTFLLLSVTLLTTAACVATFSKGALLLGLPAGIGLVLIAGAWRSARRWPWFVLAGLALLGVGGLAALSQTPRFAGLLDFETGTSFFRLKLWRSAWQMALDHPWLGVGPDNFLYAYRTRYVLPTAWQELNLSHPHNILLDVWTRLGLPGVAVTAWLLGVTVLRGWRLFRAGATAHWPLALGLLGGLAATLAHGLIDNSLFLPDLMALFMLAAGVFRRLETG